MPAQERDSMKIWALTSKPTSGTRRSPLWMDRLEEFWEGTRGPTLSGFLVAHISLWILIPYWILNLVSFLSLSPLVCISLILPLYKLSLSAPLYSHWWWNDNTFRKFWQRSLFVTLSTVSPSWKYFSSYVYYLCLRWRWRMNKEDIDKQMTVASNRIMISRQWSHLVR